MKKEDVDGPSACVRCGYDLRTIPPDAMCPECGEAVWVSRRGQLLRYADRRWLDRLDRGLRLLRWRRIAQFIVIVLIATIMVYVIATMNSANPIWLVIVVVLGLVAAMSLLMWPLWLLSAREPDGSGGPTERVTYRILNVVGIPMIVAWGCVGMTLVLPQHFWIRQLVNAAGLLVVWLHCYLMYREAQGLEIRCEYRNTGFRVARRLVLAVPPAAFVLDWLGPGRLLGTGAWRPPGPASYPFVLTVVAWLEANGALAGLRRPVAKEAAAADGDEEAEDEIQTSTMTAP